MMVSSLLLRPFPSASFKEEPFTRNAGFSSTLFQFSRIQKGSIGFERFQKDSKRFKKKQNDSKDTKKFQKIQDNQEIPKVQKDSK